MTESAVIESGPHEQGWACIATEDIPVGFWESSIHKAPVGFTPFYKDGKLHTMFWCQRFEVQQGDLIHTEWRPMMTNDYPQAIL